jgi:hypothetical protein
LAATGIALIGFFVSVALLIGSAVDSFGCAKSGADNCNSSPAGPVVALLIFGGLVLACAASDLVLGAAAAYLAWTRRDDDRRVARIALVDVVVGVVLLSIGAMWLSAGRPDNSSRPTLAHMSALIDKVETSSVVRTGEPDRVQDYGRSVSVARSYRPAETFTVEQAAADLARSLRKCGFDMESESAAASYVTPEPGVLWRGSDDPPWNHAIIRRDGNTIVLEITWS